MRQETGSGMGQIARRQEYVRSLNQQVVDFVSSNGLTRAFALASRWQKQNLGRSAGFDRLGAGVLSGFKHTTKILLRQLQGLNVLSNWQVEKSDEGVDVSDLSEEQLAGFLEEVDASEFTAAEFRAVAPVGREAQERVRWGNRTETGGINRVFKSAP